MNESNPGESKNRVSIPRRDHRILKYKPYLFLLILITTLLFISACVHVPNDLDYVRVQLKHLTEELGPEWETAIDNRELTLYAEYFGFDAGSFDARFMLSEFGRIFVARQRPQGAENKGTVLLVHGYMAHSGHLAFLTKMLADDGWTVILIDLPGNGLSDGERNDIGRFSDYGEVIYQLWNSDDFVRGGSRVIIGHSTGASGIIEGLRLVYADNTYAPDAVVLAAPLVDMVDYRLRADASSLLGDKSIEIPPALQSPSLLPRGVSQNQEFREFSTREDPLFSPVYAPGWLKAYSSWIDSWGEIPADLYDGPVLVLQGTGDSVVNWRSGLPKLYAVFPDLRIEFFENESHAILNLSTAKMEQLYHSVSAFLYVDAEL